MTVQTFLEAAVAVALRFGVDLRIPAAAAAAAGAGAAGAAAAGAVGLVAGPKTDRCTAADRFETTVRAVLQKRSSPSVVAAEVVRQTFAAL